MPKDKYPGELDGKQPFFQHHSYKPILRYGTFGFTGNKNEYGYIEALNPGIYPTEIFVLNKTGCELIARAFPGFSVKEILDALNKEFENPTRQEGVYLLCLVCQCQAQTSEFGGVSLTTSS